jgi:hypothetical protein
MLRDGIDPSANRKARKTAEAKVNWRNDPNVLNRQDIFHGAGLAFDTEVNSFKAISLICILEWERTGTIPNP